MQAEHACRSRAGVGLVAGAEGKEKPRQRCWRPGLGPTARHHMEQRSAEL